MKYLVSAILAGIILIGGVWYGKQNSYTPTQPTTFGAFTPVQGNTYFLAGAGVSNSQNTIQLTSFTLPDPNKTPVQMSMFGAIGYGVLEPQTSKIENISFTGVTQNSNGTAVLTGVSRGLSFYTPYSASSTLGLSHAGGATFILSNSAAFYGQQFLFSNSVGSSTAVISFLPTAPPQYFPSVGAQANGSFNATTSEFASIAYVNQVAISGCANASTGVRGCIQIATGLQAASSTAIGSTGALLGLPASLATDTPNASTNTSRVLMSDLTGFLKQTWLNLSQPWTFTATTTFATSTMASTTVSNGLNISVGATTTFNGGGIVGVIDYQSFVANGTWTKPLNVTGNEVVRVQMWGSGGGGGGCTNNTSSASGGGGGGAFVQNDFKASDLTSTVAVTVPGAGAGGVAGGNAGGSPAAVTFGAYLTANSGTGGSAGSGGNGSGGAGGTTSTGYPINLVGQTGASGGAGAPGATGAPGPGGGGGAAGAGTGSAGGTNTIYVIGVGGAGNTSSNSGGLNATGNAAGGGGCGSNGNAEAGGNGSVGIVRVWTIK